MRTNDRTITDLMKAVQSGAAQLPDFQRGWVWDDNRIKALIASIIHNFPVGAAMFLTYGNPEIHTTLVSPAQMSFFRQVQIRPLSAGYESSFVGG